MNKTVTRWFSAIHFSLSILLLGIGWPAQAQQWDCGVKPRIPHLVFDDNSACATELDFGGAKIPLGSGPGGFIINDYSVKKNVVLTNGKISEEGGTMQYDPDADGPVKTGATQTFTAEGDGLALHASFTPKDGCIEVSGEIENKRGGDRPVIARYLLPVAARGARFENGLSASQVIDGQTEALGTVYPVAAITGQDWGAALAIPPTAPCLFGMTGSGAGLGVEFYLGLSPLPQKFPNKASFSFHIYPALPGSGFRSALAQYYKENATYYAAPFPGSGFLLWAEPGAIDYALSLFRLQGVPGHTAAANFQPTVERAKEANLLTMEYIGSTTRDITHLPELPAGYAGAMQALADYKIAWNKLSETERQQKYPQFRYRDEMNVIDRDAIADAAGQDVLQARDFSWSPKSVAFTMNPNPWLFKDKGWVSVGSSMVQAAREYLQTDPIDGTLVDSLGANFPAHLNYRRDHFAYAQYPLTFDRSGRIAIHNMISHYELMEALRETTHAVHKFSIANGIYSYTRDPAHEENYNGQKNGRFFIAALLDEANRECSKVLTREEFEFGRAAMGRKLYNVALHTWSDPEEVRKQLNYSLPFTAFSLPETGGKFYLADKNGYFRDKDLLEWFVKYGRLLSDAGWQPVTHATVSEAGNVACERYGSGAESYFALVNFGDQPVTSVVAIDLSALNANGKPVAATEIAQNEAVTQTMDGDLCRVKVKLEPAKACILKLAPAK